MDCQVRSLAWCHQTLRVVCQSSLLWCQGCLLPPKSFFSSGRCLPIRSNRNWLCQLRCQATDGASTIILRKSSLHEGVSVGLPARSHDLRYPLCPTHCSKKELRRPVKCCLVLSHVLYLNLCCTCCSLWLVTWLMYYSDQRIAAFYIN